MSTLTESPLNASLAQSRLAEALWRAAMVMLGIMPVGMTIAHRSSPLFLGLSAACAVGALCCEGGFREAVRQACTSLRSPLGLAGSGLFVWCLVSVAWSEVKDTTFYAVGEFWLPVAFAFVLALALPRRVTSGAFWLLVVAVCLSQLLMLMDIRSGLALRKALGMRWDSYIFNRPSLTLLVLLPAVIAWFSGQARSGNILAVVLFLLVGFAIGNSDSGAAVLGLGFGTLMFLVAWLAPTLGSWMMRLAFVGALIVAPVLGPLSDRLIPNAVHHVFAKDHSRDRVDIWLSFDEAIRRQPFLGAGFGASPRLAETSVAAKVPAERRVLLAVGHPHNTPVQIWVELGVVGVLLVGAIGLLVLARVDRLPRKTKALSLALLGTILAVTMVGHGAWQGWWAAAIGAAIVWLRAAGSSPQERLS